jgi:uroporphyrinogen III methyltransferase/synthase
MIGKVFIVGAGPGDPKLITVRGLECIRQADVIIYDRLLDPSLLDSAPPSAERIYAGKESNNHALPQEQIHDLLALHASFGRTVVRLKGGDPFVFGRGGEEAAFLAERGIPFEVVPGVSSCVSVPAFAGIPVTHRGAARGFAVTTGHTCGLDGTVDYAGMLRSAGTLVILMGARNLRAIVAQLLADGIDPRMPIAVVQNGSQSLQQTVVGTLEQFAEREPSVQSPAVIVVGEVVTLRSQISWYPDPSIEIENPGIPVLAAE